MPPMPLGDHLDGAVDHLDGGLVVDGIGRTRNFGRPLLRRCHGVVRHELVPQVREDREVDDPERAVTALGWRPMDEVLPDSRFRVVLDNGHTLVCYSGGKMRKHRIRVLAGDRVSLEMSPYDLNKARITFRHLEPRKPGSPAPAQGRPRR